MKKFSLLALATLLLFSCGEEDPTNYENTPSVDTTSIIGTYTADIFYDYDDDEEDGGDDILNNYIIGDFYEDYEEDCPGQPKGGRWKFSEIKIGITENKFYDKFQEVEQEYLYNGKPAENDDDTCNDTSVTPTLGDEDSYTDVDIDNIDGFINDGDTYYFYRTDIEDSETTYEPFKLILNSDGTFLLYEEVEGESTRKPSSLKDYEDNYTYAKFLSGKKTADTVDVANDFSE